MITPEQKTIPGVPAVERIPTGEAWAQATGHDTINYANIRTVKDLIEKDRAEKLAKALKVPLGELEKKRLDLVRRQEQLEAEEQQLQATLQRYENLCTRRVSIQQEIGNAGYMLESAQQQLEAHQFTLRAEVYIGRHNHARFNHINGGVELMTHVVALERLIADIPAVIEQKKKELEANGAEILAVAKEAKIDRAKLPPDLLQK